MIVSTLNNQAYSFANRGIIYDNCTTFVGPTCSIVAIKISAMKLLYFTSPEQYFAFKNIAPFGDDAMTLVSGLCLVSFHPSEIMETLVLPHELRIGFRTSSSSCLSILSKIVTSFS